MTTKYIIKDKQKVDRAIAGMERGNVLKKICNIPVSRMLVLISFMLFSHCFSVFKNNLKS